MNNVFIYLATCNTCHKILDGLGSGADRLARREIKAEPLTAAEVDALRDAAGSYQALFSRRSQQIRKLGLDVSSFGEDDYRGRLLEHYSFLKRPVIVIDGRAFIGNAKATVEAARAAVG